MWYTNNIKKMKVSRPRNTKKRGVIEFFLYEEKGKYIGVCLTFDIVYEGQNPLEVMKNVEEAARLHLKVVCKKNLSDDLLNRYAPNEYWEKYFEFSKAGQSQKELKSQKELGNGVSKRISFADYFKFHSPCVANLQN